MIRKIDDARELLEAGRAKPEKALPAIRRLARSDQWQTRAWAGDRVAETHWILREGLRKLGPEHRDEVAAVLGASAPE